MTQRHTPGPWEFVPANDWYPGSGCGVQAKTPQGPGWPTPSATGHYAIACPPPHGKNDRAEQEANARLIAAAPDLLAALQTVAPFLYAMQSNPDLLPDTRATRERLAESARAAIAKATGQGEG